MIVLCMYVYIREFEDWGMGIVGLSLAKRGDVCFLRFTFLVERVGCSFGWIGKFPLFSWFKNLFVGFGVLYVFSALLFAP